MAKYFITVGAAERLEEEARHCDGSEPMRPGSLRFVERAYSNFSSSKPWLPQTYHLPIDRYDKDRVGWVVWCPVSPVPPKLLAHLTPESEAEGTREVKERETARTPRETAFQQAEEVNAERLRGMEREHDERIHALVVDTPLSRALVHLHQTRKSDVTQVEFRAREVAHLLQPPTIWARRMPASEKCEDPMPDLVVEGNTFAPRDSPSAAPMVVENRRVQRTQSLPYVLPRRFIAGERIKELEAAVSACVRSALPVPEEWEQEIEELRQFVLQGLRSGLDVTQQPEEG